MNINYSKIFLSLTCFCLSSICYASCNNNFALDVAIKEGFEPSDKLFACKVMPNNKQKTIVAYTKDGTLTVLILNTNNGKILNRFVDENPSFTSTGNPFELTIDTAPYIVAPNKRAFGVRVSHNLNSWDISQDLNLYLEDRSNLKEILKGLTVKFSFDHLCSGSQNAGTVSISKHSTENFFDLIVTNSKNGYDGVMGDTECTDSKAVSNTEVKTIRFKGAAYNIYDN